MFRGRLTLHAPRIDEIGARDLHEALDLLPCAMQVWRALRRYNDRTGTREGDPRWPRPVPVRQEVRNWRVRRLHRDHQVSWSHRDPAWEPDL